LDMPSDSGNIKPFQVYLCYNFVGHVERALAPRLGLRTGTVRGIGLTFR
jgi:hypothetical protein